ncbi:MAG: hypothetical protein WHS87_02635 [Anaerolineales bacterium]|jgi:hypothetical protein
MTTAKEYLSRIEEILGKHFVSRKMHLQFTWNTPEEAKQHLAQIRLMQKQLRLVKKELNATIKMIRSNFAARKAQVGTGFGSGLMAGLAGKRTVGKMNVVARENLRREQMKALSPYESVSRTIDEILVQLDRIKIQIESSINASK